MMHVCYHIAKVGVKHQSITQSITIY